MLPPRETAPENVTKSFSTAPWPASVTVMVDEPLLALNVASPAAVVSLRGVTSKMPFDQLSETRKYIVGLKTTKQLLRSLIEKAF